MRILGNIEFLKVSYVVLLFVPFLALVQHTVPLPEYLQSLRKLPLILRLVYFSSLLLSCAHMVYQGWCPSIIKRFDSPNDLYRDMLQIKALQTQYVPNDTGFTFDIAHCRDGFDDSNVRYFVARIGCSLLYVGGVLLFAAVMAIQALRVVGVFL